MIIGGRRLVSVEFQVREDAIGKEEETQHSQLGFRIWEPSIAANHLQAPEKNPNNIAKTIVPGALLMASVVKTKIDAIATHGTTVFHTPK